MKKNYLTAAFQKTAKDYPTQENALSAAFDARLSTRSFSCVSEFQPYAVSDQRSEGLCGNAGYDRNEEHTAGASVFI